MLSFECKHQHAKCASVLSMFRESTRSAHRPRDSLKPNECVSVRSIDDARILSYYLSQTTITHNQAQPVPLPLTPRCFQLQKHRTNISRIICGFVSKPLLNYSALSGTGCSPRPRRCRIFTTFAGISSLKGRLWICANQILQCIISWCSSANASFREPKSLGSLIYVQCIGRNHQLNKVEWK